jgi:hypothetical protein
MAVLSRIFLGVCRATSRKYARHTCSVQPVLELFTKVCESEGGGVCKSLQDLQMTGLYKQLKSSNN